MGVARKAAKENTHVTTITGPQAEAIRRALERESGLDYVDKNVPGLVILEVYADD